VSRQRAVYRAMIIFFMVMLTELASAELYLGTLHCHSKCSDGTLLPIEVVFRAKAAGSMFLGETDHYSHLLVTWSKSLTEARFRFYRVAFTTRFLPVIVGSEFSAKHDKTSSHIVALRTEAVTADETLSKLDGKSGIQQELLDRLELLGYATIAAHPNKKADSFDWTKLKGLDAVEFGNDGSREAERQTLADYLALLSKGHLLGVTGGCDSHTPLDPLDSARWRRKTGVVIAGVWTPAGTVDAIKSGQTWFARGIELVRINYDPGFSPHRTSGSVVIQFDLRKSVAYSPRIRIYRDSNLVDTIGGSKESGGVYRYSWVEPEPIRGKHYYNLVEENLDFVTSPIMFEVSPG
jgi:hypothetical protein